MHTSRKLEVILKLTEVCNIACSYCYYFFSGDERPTHRPAHIQTATTEGLIRFINCSYREGHFDTVQVDLHGGEPLMLGPARFAELCKSLRERIEAPLRLCATTNAMLVDQRWVELFGTFEVNVCVSIDGKAEVHDKRRIDKRGIGTHGRVLEGYWKLKRGSEAGTIGPPAVLCVVDPDSDPVETYNYLTRELEIESLDFLMPDHTHDTAERTADIAAWMTATMSCWLDDDRPSIRVRTFNSVLSLLASGRSYLAGFGSSQPLVMTVGSDGEVDLDDFLKPCGVDVIATKQNIRSATFGDIFTTPAAVKLREEMNRVPKDCEKCAFLGVCRGGQITHRFSAARGFDNASIYCDAQYGMFRLGASHLMSTGVSANTIANHCVADART